MWVKVGLFALSILFGAMLADPASTQPYPGRGGDWELLGSQTVGFNVDRDVIQVGRREGRFTRIALEVRDNDIFMFDLKVVFMNGEVQDIPIRTLIRRGTRSRPLDLAGGERVIKQIEMVYRTRPGFGGRAVVNVYGEQDRRFPGPGPGAGPGPGPGPGIGRWEELGCKRVGFIIDRDVIPVGRQEGRFRAIRLRVQDNKVYMMDLRVIYANGEPDNIPVRDEIRPGRETRPLDLRGDRRAIRQIEMVYRSQPNFRGQARVCVDGLQ
jgi:hypothetical protein